MFDNLQEIAKENLGKSLLLSTSWLKPESNLERVIQKFLSFA